MNEPSAATDTMRIATRGSALALWQARFVEAKLRAVGCATEILVLKTTGDLRTDRPLHEIGGKGLFIKELEEALLDGRADLAVHSLKDMPARLLPQFTLAAVLSRHVPFDALVFRTDVAKRIGLLEVGDTAPLSVNQAQSLGALTIGTGSLRRQALLKRFVPAWNCHGLRGNVDTRLRKLADGAFDGIILAGASLERLGIKDVVMRPLGLDWFVPSPAQGALAIETLVDARCRKVLARFEDHPTRQAVEIERGLLALLGGDCTMPCGMHATPALSGKGWNVRATVLALDGDAAQAEVVADDDVGRLVEALGAGLRDDGLTRIFAKLGLTLPSALR